MTVAKLFDHVRMVTDPQEGNWKQQAASAAVGIALTALLYSQTSQWLTARRLPSMGLRIAAMALPPTVTLATREVAKQGMLFHEGRQKITIDEIVANLKVSSGQVRQWLNTRNEGALDDPRVCSFVESFEALESGIATLRVPADGLTGAARNLLTGRAAVENLLRSDAAGGTTP